MDMRATFYWVKQRQVLKMTYDVIVIGGGPAGLAAVLSARKENVSVLLIEREPRLGGILKQCIHEGFGLIRFDERLAGCEYACRWIKDVLKCGAHISLLTFASKIKKIEEGFMVTLVNRAGLRHVTCKTIILSTGCRERTSKQVNIHGTRPAGVFTAGTAQYYINILGQMPGKRCVILGSGDIGLIMARRLTLEGASVLGVYEAKATPSGLTRNISQCLNDFNIPLYVRHTVTELHGIDRLMGVTVMKVDNNMKPIENTQKVIYCDTLILSVGLIPENELAETLNVAIDNKTKGPICDQNSMTSVEGLFVCGNALHVNDLVDYVSESGELTGKSAALYVKSKRNYAEIDYDDNYLYVVPQRIDVNDNIKNIVFFFRSKQTRGKTNIKIIVKNEEIFSKEYYTLNPPEMKRIVVDFSKSSICLNSKIKFIMEDS